MWCVFLFTKQRRNKNDDFEIKERYELVKLFDEYCDYFIDAFKYAVENVTVEEKEVVTKIKVYNLD